MSGATLDVFGYRITLSTKLGVSQRYKNQTVWRNSHNPYTTLCPGTDLHTNDDVSYLDRFTKSNWHRGTQNGSDEMPPHRHARDQDICVRFPAYVRAPHNAL